MSGPGRVAHPERIRARARAEKIPRAQAGRPAAGQPARSGDLLSDLLETAVIKRAPSLLKPESSRPSGRAPFKVGQPGRRRRASLMPVMKKLFAAKGEPAPDWRVPVMAMGTTPEGPSRSQPADRFFKDLTGVGGLDMQGLLEAHWITGGVPRISLATGNRFAEHKLWSNFQYR